jgi:UV excision repair protein RAD23
MDVPTSPPSIQPANPVQAAQAAQTAAPSGPNANPLDLFPQVTPLCACRSTFFATI